MLFFFLYIVIINLLTFIVWGIDKYRATKNQWRISEKQLLILVFCGGFLGGLIGMSLRRHKTIKEPFLWKFWMIGLVWVGVMGYAIYRLEM